MVVYFSHLRVLAEWKTDHAGRLEAANNPERRGRWQDIRCASLVLLTEMNWESL